MKHRHKQALAVLVAFVLVVPVYFIWAGTISDAIGAYILAPFLDDEEVHVEIDLSDAEMVDIDEWKKDNFEDEVIMHSAPEISKAVILKKQEVVPTQKEPDQDAKTNIIDVIMQNQTEKELDQWGITNWLSISIPSISVRAPIMYPEIKYWNAKEWDLLEEQMQVGLLHGATAYPHSMKPGSMGTLFVAGHSSPPHERAKESAYGHMFKNLSNVDRGDKITIAGKGTIVTYEVIRTHIVSAKDTSILSQQNDKSMLKLITCHPVGSTKDRFVVTAVKVN
ncbi:TPA: hypothetical protein DE059_05495 [Candidatus Peribacteria bacterium]|jgi:LPXTG-site transpeptidase (sortase) family protein|nr:hypothetical protein [Candidatus Peribacteria bacterium]|tara:strand:+ start:1809 stop:2645 length:837 start_codon:yes stop_codon:yes gene_type:complete